jgi:protein-S-isoprenylcysteine O-methyltransferase Ste14
MTTPATPARIQRERALLIAILVAFATFSTIAVAVEGIGAITDAITSNWLSVQIFIDLVIAIGLIAVWIHRDATKRGRNPWPWIIASPFVGVLAPLAYLITRKPTE